jgi:hypothetical protein
LYTIKKNTFASQTTLPKADNYLLIINYLRIRTK